MIGRCKTLLREAVQLRRDHPQGANILLRQISTCASHCDCSESDDCRKNVAQVMEKMPRDPPPGGKY